MTLNNMMFFDINYLEYYSSYTGTSVLSATVGNVIDNRAVPTMDFSAAVGAMYLTTTDYYTCSNFFICEHNLSNFSIVLNTGTTWYTSTTYTNNTLSTTYSALSSTVDCYGMGVTFDGTQDNDVAYIGEMIMTKEKFTLNYNPSKYVPAMVDLSNFKRLYGGRSVYSTSGNYFTAKIAWDHLIGDVDPAVSTDLKFVSELARRKTSFLFWPNANGSDVNMYTWLPQHVFKCKITTPETVYEFSSRNLTNIIKVQYTIEEMQ